MNKKDIIKNSALFLGSIAFCFIFLEIGLRIAGYEPITRRYKIRHPVAGAFHMPNRDFIIDLPYENPEFVPHVITNSVGMLDIEYSEKKDTDKIRGAVLGDSFCAGLEVRRDEVFHTILENTMEVKGKKVEFLNFGVRGIGLTQQIQLFRTLAGRFDPDFVFLSIYLSNDMQDNLHFYQKGFPDPLMEGSHLDITLEKRVEYIRKRFNFFLADYTRVYPFLNLKYDIFADNLENWWNGTLPRKNPRPPAPQPTKQVPNATAQLVRPKEKLEMVQSPGNFMEAKSTPVKLKNLFNTGPESEEDKALVGGVMARYYELLEKEAGVPERDKRAYHMALAEKEPLVFELMLLKRLHDLLNARGIKLYPFYFDHKSKLLGLSANDKKEVKLNFWVLKRFFQEQNIPHYNLMKDFAQTPVENYNHYYYVSDIHWNARGHLFAANKLRVFLEKSLMKDFKSKI